LQEKTCTRCAVKQPLSHFSKTVDGLHGVSSWCKQCFRDYGKEKQAEQLQFLRELKEQNGCADCGETFPHYMLEYDHVPERGPKLFNLSEWWPRKKILEELEKCDVVCCNCHSVRTWERGQQGLIVV
jgi:hypothetical protein